MTEANTDSSTCNLKQILILVMVTKTDFK